MIYDPKQDYGWAPAPATNCPECGQSYQPDDQIVRYPDPARGVDTYWHRACLTRHSETLTAERKAEFDRWIEEGSPAALEIARMRAVIRGER